MLSTLSFGEYKGKLKQLESDNLELMKALRETTDNLTACMKAYKALLQFARKTLDDKQIDQLMVDYVEAHQQSPKGAA